MSDMRVSPSVESPYIPPKPTTLPLIPIPIRLIPIPNLESTARGIPITPPPSPIDPRMLRIAELAILETLT